MIRLREDPAFCEGVMRCVRCSICVPHCPSYAVFRNEADSPRGRVQLLRAVVEGRVAPEPALERHLDNCLACRACEDVCPSGVPWGELLDKARHELSTTRYGHWRKAITRGFLARFVAMPARLALVARLLAFVQLLRLDRLARWLVRPFSARRARQLDLLPRIEGTPFEPDEAPRPEAPTAAFHAGCIMASALGDVQRAALRVLAHAGHATLVPPDQRCCGALHQHAGMREEARELARENIAAFERADVPIVTTSAGCALAMKEYPRLLADDPAWARRATTFAARVCDLAELADTGPTPAGRVAVHEACHHWNVQRLRNRGLDVLKRRGAEVVALPRGAGCCGAAGLWSATHPDAAWRLLDATCDEIERSACSVVSVANPGCLMHIRAGLRARGSDVRVLHLAEVLDPEADDRDS